MNLPIKAVPPATRIHRLRESAAALVFAAGYQVWNLESRMEMKNIPKTWGPDS